MRMTGKGESLSRFHFVLKERYLFGVEKRCPVQALADRLPSGFVGAVRNVGSTNRNLLLHTPLTIVLTIYYNNIYKYYL